MKTLKYRGGRAAAISSRKQEAFGRSLRIKLGDKMITRILEGWLNELASNLSKTAKLKHSFQETNIHLRERLFH